MKNTDNIAGKDRRFRAVAIVCVAVCAAVGIVALLGWFFDVPVLSSFGTGKKPMGPSTAVLLILFAFSIFARVQAPKNGKIKFAAACIVLFIAAACVSLFIASSSGIFLHIEHLGLPIPHLQDGIPLGHMSKVTSLGLPFAAISYLLLLFSSKKRPWLADISWVLSCAFIFVGITLALSFAFGTPMLFGDILILPSAPSTVAFFSLGLAIFHLALPRTWLFRDRTEHAYFSYYILTLTFIVISSAFITGGYVYLRAYEKHFERQIENQLEAVAKLKVLNVSKWWNERLGIATVFHDNEIFAELVEKYSEVPENVQAKRKLEQWLEKTKGIHQYDGLILFDSMGGVTIELPHKHPGIPDKIKEKIPEALKSDKITRMDFFRDTPDSPVHLAIMVPVFDRLDKRPLGVLVFIIDPTDYLYPFIQRWPAPTDTAETLLVRKDGSDVLFLNDLRFKENAALNLRISLIHDEVPAVKAVTGVSGIVEGIDYKGFEVVAYILDVPGTDWSLVAKMAKSELYAALRERMFGVSLLIVFMIFNVGIAIAFVWRQQSLSFYRERYLLTETLRESERRLRRAEEIGHLGHWNYDPEMKTVSLSDEMISIFGLPPGELNTSPEKMFAPIHPEDGNALMKFVAEIVSKGKSEIQCRIIGPGGALRYITGIAEMNRLYEDAEAYTVFGTALDTTELKRAEIELKEKNDELMRFTYTVSHDLKSPLVTIRTFAGYLQKDIGKQDAERINSDISYILNASQKMSRLLDELLQLSRIGRIVNAVTEAPFQSVVAEAMKLCAGEIDKNKVEIIVTQEPAALFGDIRRLIEVFQNLIDNSIKFMGSQPSPEIQIGFDVMNGNKVYYVKDNGAGIDNRYLSKVFDLFEKLDPSTEGTGIGLALVQRIIEVHGGKIWVESGGVGKGAIFRFTLPNAELKPEQGVRS